MGDTPGIFIAIDGIDGSGKTTLSGQLQQLLADYEPEITKEPTAESEWGRRLRQSAVEGRLPRETEIEFFHKDRLHHIETLIRPCLEEGRIVICDRYVDSTLAFQAEGPAEAETMYRNFVGDIIVPDITFILMCPVSVGLTRIQENRPEKSTFEEVETLTRAHEIYAARAKLGGRYVPLDATASVQHTLRQTLSALVARYPHLTGTLRAHYARAYPSEEQDF